MAKYYSVAQLSDRISETPEGFLICEGVAIARAGDLLYSPSETPITPGAGPTIITRSIADIHDPATIASFEGKPVTLNHPEGGEFVTPENWQALAVGVVQHVRPGAGEDADKLLADLLIMEVEAIAAVKSKALRELSCGYEANYIEESLGHGRQEDIVGNHVAIVQTGRCGSECAIFDHAPTQEDTTMTLKEKVLGLLAKAFDEFPPKENEKEAAKDAEKKKEEASTEDATKTALDAIMKRMDAMEAKGGAELDKRLALMEAALAKLLGIEETETETETTDKAKAGDQATQLVLCTDQDTITRAEILAPGIVKTADVKVKSLDACMATEEGKAVLTVLLAGKTLDTADTDQLFVAASEMLKGVRRAQLVGVRAVDAYPAMQAGEMTPEKINEANAARYAVKS